MKIPTNNLNIPNILNTLNTDYAIQVQTTCVQDNTLRLIFYNVNGIIVNSDIFNIFSFYYLQPVKINGTYNFIQNVIFNQNYTSITLYNNLNLIVNNIYNLIISPHYNNLYN